MKQYIYFFFFSYSVMTNLQAAGGAGASASREIDALGWVHPASSETARKNAIVLVKKGLESLKDERYNTLALSSEIPNPGRASPYDRATEISLRAAAKVFQSASSAELKVADLGCGSGSLTVLLPFISNGSKPFTIGAVDGVEDNIKELKARWTRNEKDLPAGVKLNVMTRLLQDLPKTKYFGPGAHGTFDLIFCLNVLHCMSVREKQEALNYMYRLLRPGGIVVVSHNLVANSINLPLLPRLRPGTHMFRHCIEDHAKGKKLGLAVEIIPVPEVLKDASPQAIIILDGAKYKLIDMKELTERMLAEPPLEYFYRINEVVTEDSLGAKLLLGGFSIKESATYTFKNPGDTDFGRLTGSALPYFSLAASCVVGTKPS